MIFTRDVICKYAEFLKHMDFSRPCVFHTSHGCENYVDCGKKICVKKKTWRCACETWKFLVTVFWDHLRWFAGTARRSLATAGPGNTWQDAKKKTQHGGHVLRQLQAGAQRCRCCCCRCRLLAPCRRCSLCRSLVCSRAGHVPAPACPRGSNGRRRRLRSRCVHGHQPLLQEESMDTWRLLRL